MKKIMMIFLTISIFLISACQNGNEIVVNIDFDNYVATTDNVNIDVSLNVLEQGFNLEIVVPANDLKYDLVVNGKKIKSNKYDFANNKITYNFKASDFLNSEDYLKYRINFDLSFGVFSKEELLKFEPLSIYSITEKNNQFEYKFSVFNKSKTGLKFHSKVFLKHYEEIDVYQPIYVDEMTSNIEDISGFDYDYIITYNNHLDFQNNSELKDFFSDKVLDKTIVTNKGFFDDGEVVMNVYDKNSISFVIDGENNYELPTLYLEDITFNGWKWNDQPYLNIQRLKVKDNINIINLKPDFEPIEINDLYKQLDKLIPSKLNNDLTLPSYFSGYNITWESSDWDVLTNEGQYKIPYNKKNLNLTANLVDILGNHYQKTYELETNYKKSL